MTSAFPSTLAHQGASQQDGGNGIPVEVTWKPGKESPREDSRVGTPAGDTRGLKKTVGLAVNVKGPR